MRQKLAFLPAKFQVLLPPEAEWWLKSRFPKSAPNIDETSPVNTPVALFLFNRPDLTARVFERIAQSQPRQLLLVADGPRHEAEATLCEQARAVVGAVSWECEVHTNFSEVNLGCKRRVSSGLDWVFSLVERAIILEDDCLPAPDFFVYCAAMLDRYKADTRIMHISGDNFVPAAQTAYSHYFSRYFHVWGWATWRRAWQHYDVEMSHWPAAREDVLGQCADAAEKRHWSRFFDAAQRGDIDTWDVQWVLACWLQSGLAVVPRVNLISNIGFRADATHPKAPPNFADLPVQPWQDVNSVLPTVMANQHADGLDRALWVAPSAAQLWQRRLQRRLKRVPFLRN